MSFFRPQMHLIGIVEFCFYVIFAFFSFTFHILDLTLIPGNYEEMNWMKGP